MADQRHFRPSVDEYFLGMAELASYRGTCARRRVGCILVDRYNRVLSTGYNGVASGLPHCTDKPCKGASLPSGTGLNLCEAIHAEANALISCRDPEDIYAAYCSASPCVHCVRMLMNTPCVRIVFTEEYPHPESRDLWLGRPDREWLHIPRG